MAEQGLSPEVQQQLVQLQTMSQQLQQVQQQRLQFEAMKREADAAIEALDALPDDAPVYRSLGALLVKDTGKADALTRLKDEQETLEIRIKRAGSQEQQLRESATELQQRLQKILG